MFFLVFFLTLVVLGFVAILLTVTMKLKMDREKFSVFECGFELLSKLRLPFSLNFFFVIIIFLIFDVELILILPFIFNMEIVELYSAMLVMSFFFIILIVGFIYEWGAGLLNWLI